MKEIAATHVSAKPRRQLAPILLLVAAAMLLTGLFSGTAGAAPVGKDGLIHACYKVKGKPKGSMRVVASAKQRCRRGERKVAWSVASISGQPGPQGQSGASGQGQSGSGGADGAPGSNEAALQAKIASLSLKVDSLEGILDGLNNDGLKGAVNAVGNLTHGDLLDAVGAVSLLDNVCGQVTALTDRTNTLGGALGAVVSLVNAVPLIGGVLDDVSVPATPLTTIPCTTP